MSLVNTVLIIVPIHDFISVDDCWKEVGTLLSVIDASSVWVDLGYRKLIESVHISEFIDGLSLIKKFSKLLLWRVVSFCGPTVFGVYDD